MIEENQIGNKYCADCGGHGISELYIIKERKDGKTSKDRLEKEGVERRGDA